MQCGTPITICHRNICAIFNQQPDRFLPPLRCHIRAVALYMSLASVLAPFSIVTAQHENAASLPQAPCHRESPIYARTALQQQFHLENPLHRSNKKRCSGFGAVVIYVRITIEEESNNLYISMPNYFCERVRRGATVTSRRKHAPRRRQNLASRFQYSFTAIKKRLQHARHGQWLSLPPVIPRPRCRSSYRVRVVDR